MCMGMETLMFCLWFGLFLQMAFTGLLSFKRFLIEENMPPWAKACFICHTHIHTHPQFSSFFPLHMMHCTFPSRNIYYMTVKNMFRVPVSCGAEMTIHNNDQPFPFLKSLLCFASLSFFSPFPCVHLFYFLSAESVLYFSEPHNFPGLNISCKDGSLGEL